jgi:hypothetical protein
MKLKQRETYHLRHWTPIIIYLVNQNGMGMLLLYSYIRISLNGGNNETGKWLNVKPSNCQK